MRAYLAICSAEALESEQALLRGDCGKLRTAKAFIYGSMLSSALWSVIGLLTWRMIA